eukprot:702747-Hanusia_phi.AAC.1
MKGWGLPVRENWGGVVNQVSGIGDPAQSESHGSDLDEEDEDEDDGDGDGLVCDLHSTPCESARWYGDGV